MKKSLEPVRHLLPYFLLGLLLLFVPFDALAEPVEGDAAGGDRITYDQRQSGKYNIHVSIKDVAIIEMDQNEIEDDSYNEEDYYYDEGDLTVKPLPTRSTTTKKSASQNQTTTKSATTGVPLSTLNGQELPTISTTIPEFLLTTIHNHNYSPNLLADIAATQAAANHNNANTLINATTPTILTTTPYTTPARRTPTPNVVILETSAATTEQHSPASTHSMPAVLPAKLVAGRTKEIPVIMEPVLQPRQRYSPTTMRMHPAFMLQERPTQLENSGDQPTVVPNEDSKIFKFKVRRAQKLAYPAPATFGSGAAPYYAAGAFGRRCRSHQYRDVSGNCRHKRSSSILKKLFRMLVSLPFANERDDQSSNE